MHIWEYFIIGYTGMCGTFPSVNSIKLVYCNLNYLPTDFEKFAALGGGMVGFLNTSSERAAILDVWETVTLGVTANSAANIK